MKKSNWITCPNCLAEVKDLEVGDECPHCYQIVKGVEPSCPSVWMEGDWLTAEMRFKKQKEVKMKNKKVIIENKLNFIIQLLQEFNNKINYYNPQYNACGRQCGNCGRWIDYNQPHIC